MRAEGTRARVGGMALGVAALGVVALGAIAVACRIPLSSERLEGHWVGILAEGVSAEAQPAADAFATTTELEFRRNEITVRTPALTQYGRYQVVRDEPNSVAITTDRDGPAHPQTFLFAGDDTLRWAVSDGKSIVFARQ
jgi:hypothetical protein